MSRAIDANEEARAFWAMRWRMVRNVVTQALREARLRVSVVTGLSLIFWVGLFLLFIDGFQFVNSLLEQPKIQQQTYGAIFDIFFASLLVMLIFSTGIILYGSLYRSREAQLLLTLPVRSARVFLHKFQEATLLSSWGFVLLGTPILAAYGIVEVAPWYYFLLILPFVVAFVHIPAATGAILCMALVRWLPRVRLHLLVLAGGMAIGGSIYLAWTVFRGAEVASLNAAWFQEMIARLQFSRSRLLPSWWLSRGLMEAAQGQWSESILFLVLLISNALFGQLVAWWLSARIYRVGYTALRSQRRARRLPGVSWADVLLGHSLGVLSRPMRLLIIKDIRLFRRDPIQWSQYAIFFGLLALYFLNIRRFTYDVGYAEWINVVAFLNFAVIGLILSIFTSRFVYPLISLEGQRFWILGRLPLARDAILWSKFVFAVGATLVPSALLIVLSDTMLRIDGAIVVCHLLSCVVLCTGLAGISVGLGAKMPNLREESPSKITSGFGGTLNQVLSTLYIIVATVIPAVHCHFYVASLREPGEPATWLVVQGTAVTLVIGLAVTVLPLRIGQRAFRLLEF